MIHTNEAELRRALEIYRERFGPGDFSLGELEKIILELQQKIGKGKKK